MFLKRDNYQIFLFFLERLQKTCLCRHSKSIELLQKTGLQTKCYEGKNLFNTDEKGHQCQLKIKNEKQCDHFDTYIKKNKIRKI